jgi:hypothetical protein
MRALVAENHRIIDAPDIALAGNDRRATIPKTGWQIERGSPISYASASGEAEIQRTRVLHSLLFSSGRPILFRPGREDTKDAAIMGEPIVIGWNGSVEAVRAVTGALPLIQTSRLVEVISIGEKSVNAFDAYELAKYLSWSGVRAAATGIALEDWTGGDVVDAALDRGAKLLVMGARVNGNATNHVIPKSGSSIRRPSRQWWRPSGRPALNRRKGRACRDRP